MAKPPDAGRRAGAKHRVSLLPRQALPCVGSKGMISAGDGTPSGIAMKLFSIILRKTVGVKRFIGYNNKRVPEAGGIAARKARPGAGGTGRERTL